MAGPATRAITIDLRKRAFNKAADEAECYGLMAGSQRTVYPVFGHASIILERDDIAS